MSIVHEDITPTNVGIQEELVTVNRPTEAFYGFL